MKFYNFHFSEEFLDNHQIEYEVYRQQPGNSVFAPGNPMFQVYNEDDSISINYHLLPFCCSAIKDCCESFDFYTRVTKWHSPIPLMKVLYMVVLTGKATLSVEELINLGQYLLLNTADIDEAHKANIEVLNKLEIHKTIKNVGQLEVSNCESCSRPLFLRCYCLHRPGSKMRICEFCCSEPNIDFVHLVEVKTLFEGFKSHLSSMIDSKFQDIELFGAKELWDLKPHRLGNFERLDTPNSKVNIIEVVTTKTKAERMKALLMIREQEINDINDKILKANGERSKRRLLAELATKTASAEYYMRCLDKQG